MTERHHIVGSYDYTIAEEKILINHHGQHLSTIVGLPAKKLMKALDGADDAEVEVLLRRATARNEHDKKHHHEPVLKTTPIDIDALEAEMVRS